VIAAHSPGPWRVTDEISRFSGGEVIRPNRSDGVDSPVAYVADFNRYDRDEERQANARLIAAAPDLLDALIALKEVVDVIASEECEEGTRVEWWNRRIGVGWQAAVQADTAIARAEGRA
jgi:hypothetical protein